jgi:DNA polymerase-4
MLTVTAMNLVHAEEAREQITFFDGEETEKRKRSEKLESTVDEIRARYGKSALTSGAVIGYDIGIK